MQRGPAEARVVGRPAHRGADAGNSGPTGNRIMGRLLAAERSSEALILSRDSSGNHHPLHGSLFRHRTPRSRSLSVAAGGGGGQRT
jgi:hypothetical protein